MDNLKYASVIQRESKLSSIIYRNTRKTSKQLLGLLLSLEEIKDYQKW